MFELLATLPVKSDVDTKKISVYRGDLTTIPDDHALDLLIISAFPNGYSPSPSSLIGALASKGLSVHQLAKQKLHDLRKVCNFWLSRRLEDTGGVKNISQLACFESG